MPSKKVSTILSDKLELYDRLVSTNPQIQRKGKNVPYTSVNGHMFTYLQEPGTLAIRLPSKEREEFLKRYGASLMEAYGIIQKEYVRVPDEMLGDTNELSKYFNLSYEYVKTLKPK